MTWLAIKGFFGGVPQWVWLAIAAVAIVAGSYTKGRSDMNDKWIADLEKRADAKEAQAEEANATATAESEHRAAEFTEQQEELETIIEEAKTEGSNPLDALLGGL